MDFKLTKAQLLQQELFRNFAETEIKPIAKDMDEAEEYSQELVAKLQKIGAFGIPYSREYGGQGADVLTYTLAMEEMSKVDASTGITLSVHTSLCCACINEFGTEEQKQEFLRPLVDGHKVGCYGLTEPNAGTDAAGVQTTADKDGDDYIINGSKMFTTNSGFADTFVVFALTDKSKGPRGMSAFVLDRTMPGISVSENIERMGIRAASNCAVTYENVRVPASRMLGKEGQGYKIAMTALGGGRIGIGAQSVGIAQGAIDEAMKYVKERKQGGRTINKYQNTQFKLAECQTKVDAARLMVWRAATAKDNHENYAPLAAMCKLFASDVANEVTRICVQLLGGYGYCREYPVERAMRDAKITEIYEGTSEAMKMIISGSMKV
ncbi:acyl-CoA dehydrogenase family protein [Clostridium sp. MD294]|uniref:acyl-CoA dehydrogenase family protein n=1 Tax=Clostridium sp. MD294 TaxID=97138 RepID=UPI0002CB45D4|nr:acyl-CoA dehydrogenase family protein [Clostridium sp. MD294]NDO47714.1 acyl-CoA dehydrogenase [Clostridium sp. MD294]USF29968.1 Acyl-CoA dehydrogenase, short-chain specific [Clostridium sp. MD294]